MATADPAFNPNTALGTATVGTGLTLSGGTLSNPSVGATYLTQTASSDLSAEQAMGSLATGLVKNTTLTGVQSIAVAGTDYVAPSAWKQFTINATADSKVTFTDADVFFDDRLENLWTASLAGTGVRNRGAISDVELTSGATSSGVASQLLGTSLGGGFPLYVPSGSTSKFYVEFRMKVTTAIDNQAFLGFGDNTVNAWGARGPSATGFYVARFDNGPTTLTSTIAVDTSYHTFRVWRDGTTGFLQVDSETPVSSANAYNASDTRAVLRVENGGTSAARTARFDYVFIKAERP